MGGFFHFFFFHFPILIAARGAGNEISLKRVLTARDLQRSPDLENNPRKDPERYTGRDIEHMRRVVAYCKRHLAQEEMAKQNTGSKSYRSLKN